ncbi:MAG: hypothetical protein IV100_19940 [Myxococcales bacterium]|nr:hypothetical protein [Myxococcales bacterium]
MHLDAGDLWQAEYQVPEAKRPEIASAAKVLMAAYKRFDVKGAAIGDRDLALGIETLKAFRKDASFEFLSVNLTDEAGALLFAPSLLTTVGGQKIGVIGATTALFMNREQVQTAGKYRVEPPAPRIAAEVDKLKAAGATVFILLGHLNRSEIEEAVQAAPAINLVLGGQWLDYDQTIEKVGKALVVGGFQRGKNLSVLSAFVKNGSTTFIDRNARGALENKKRDLESQIVGRSKLLESARNDPAQKDTLTFYEQNLVQLKTDLQTVTMDLEDLAEPSPDSSWVKWELKPMDTTLAEDPKVLEQIEKHREKYPDPTKRPAAAPGAAPGH